MRDSSLTNYCQRAINTRALDPGNAFITFQQITDLYWVKPLLSTWSSSFSRGNIRILLFATASSSQSRKIWSGSYRAIISFRIWSSGADRRHLIGAIGGGGRRARSKQRPSWTVSLISTYLVLAKCGLGTLSGLCESLCEARFRATPDVFALLSHGGVFRVEESVLQCPPCC